MTFVVSILWGVLFALLTAALAGHGTLQFPDLIQAPLVATVMLILALSGVILAVKRLRTKTTFSLASIFCLLIGVACSVRIFSSAELTKPTASSKEFKENVINNAVIAAIGKKFRSGDAASALRDVETYLTEYPDDVRGLTLKGWTLSKLGKNSKAEASFDAALMINPQYANAYVGKGSIARARGDNIKARELYTRAFTLDPQDEFVLTSLCAVDLTEQKFAEAVNHCESAYRINSEIPFIAANLAVAYHQAGELKKRDELYERCKELNYDKIAAMEVMFYGNYKS